MLKNKFPKMKMFEEAGTQSNGYNFIIEIFRYIIVFIVAELLASIPSVIFFSQKILSDPAVYEMIKKYNSGDISYDEYIASFTELINSGGGMLVSLFATAISAITIFCYCRLIEKRKLSTMGFRKNKFVVEYLIGLLIGGGLLAASVGVCAAVGAASVTAAPSVNIGIIALFFAGFVIQGMNEEVMMRGALMVSLSRRTPIAWAAVISSVGFGLMHLGNPGVTVLAVVNISLFGLLEAIYIIKRGNIWGACAIHSMWNFAQGNIFGISVSGTGKSESLFVTGFMSDKALINGGDFGVEGGLAVTVIVSIAIVVLIFTKPNEYEIAENTISADGITAEDLPTDESMTDQ